MELAPIDLKLWRDEHERARHRTPAFITAFTRFAEDVLARFLPETPAIANAPAASFSGLAQLPAQRTDPYVQPNTGSAIPVSSPDRWSALDARPTCINSRSAAEASGDTTTADADRWSALDARPTCINSRSGAEASHPSG